MSEQERRGEQGEPSVRVIKANKMLQAKVGSGPLDEAVIRRCQSVMDANNVDFAPLANEYLEKLEGAIADARLGDQDRGENVAAMTIPVMQLKANAGTFGYDLIGRLANVMLSFLEGVKQVDDDVLSVVDAHHKTLNAIVSNKIRGDGGDYGRQLEQELQGACKRYFSKRS